MRCPNCKKPIAMTSTCCLNCWKLLPRGLRQKINRAQRRNNDKMLHDQMTKAFNVWREAPMQE